VVGKVACVAVRGRVVAASHRVVWCRKSGRHQPSRCGAKVFNGSRRREGARTPVATSPPPTSHPSPFTIQCAEPSHSSTVPKRSPVRATRSPPTNRERPPSSPARRNADSFTRFVERYATRAMLPISANNRHIIRSRGRCGVHEAARGGHHRQRRL